MKFFSMGLLFLMLTGCAGSAAFSRAQKLYAVGDYDNAVLAYAEAVDDSPTIAEYRMRLQLARQSASLVHEKKGSDLLEANDFQGALQEFQLSKGLDASNETSQIKAHQAELHIEAEKMVTEAKKMMRDRHFKQANQLVKDALGILTDYQPALDLQKELMRHSSTMIDGIELEVTSSEPITLNFKAANLPDVFDILTQLSGIRFILDDDIRTQTTTLFLEKATFAQALELLLRMNNLDKKILNSKTIILFPNSKAKQKQFGDQVIQTFYLSNIDAKKAVNLLRTMLQVRKIYVHEELNAIVLRDTPEVIRLAQKIIEANDRPTSEVVFDLELVEVSHTKNLKIGATLPSTISAGLKVPGGADAIGSVITSSFNNMKFLYQIPSASFDLSKKNGDAEILASPKIRVKNKGKAKVHIGSREPVVTVTTSGTNGDQRSDSVQYVDVGVKLDIEPTIQLDDTIVTKIGLEVSNVSNRDTINQGTTVLTISTTNANTELILKDGVQTIIGGLLRDDNSKSKTGIPILSDIPVLGALFSNYAKDKTKREILLSITPHIVRSLKLPEGETATIWSGGEDDLRVGRNFGSFADEYLEGQGNTPIKVVPSQTSTAIIPFQPQFSSKPVSVNSTPVSGDKPMDQPQQIPAPVAPVKPITKSELKQKTSSVDSGLGAPVPQVVLPELLTPPVITRPSIFLEGDRVVKVGSHFVLSLSIQDVKNLFSAPLYIRFDPNLVEFVKASEGSFLQQGGEKTIFTSTPMSDSGRIVVGLKQGAGGKGASGGGLLATLEFKAKAAGKVSIAPERINFRNPAGERLAVDSRGLIVEVQ